MKNELKERMDSEGFGTFEEIEGMKSPEYSEEIVEEDKVEKSEKNQIKGGLADNLSVKDIAEKHKVSIEEIKKQLKMGIDVEMEHTDEPSKAMEIAMDHLTESPSYYTELEKMESKLK